MPIYEYQCDGCQTVFEVRQRISDPAPKSHSCGSDQVRRLLSATSFVLKGTGWYATDYGNRSAPPSEGDAKGGGAQDAAKGDAKAAPGSEAGGKAAAKEGSAKAEGGAAAGKATAEAAKPKAPSATAAAPQAKSAGKPAAG